MEEVAPNSCTRPGLEKKAKPQEQLNCPRCNSTNTKFCYYNNYSLTQPRYFCKTCRRYWTEGGSLRNVPVGGGSRKNKKISSYVSSKVPDLNPSSVSDAVSSQNPKMQGLHDLNLSFPLDKYHGMSSYVEMPKLEIGDSTSSHHHNSSSSSAPNSLSAVELLRSSMASRVLNPNYVPNSMMLSSSDPLYQPPGYPMQETKPNLSFSVDGFGNRSYENGAGRLLFPFGDIKHLSTGVEVDNNKEQANNSTGYWSGIIGEGSSW